ncbi:hypothetical protein Moror_1753 [Moniliophthora roreri MCA 2997]|uniref:tripeptidyl-peptidase II n=1 Tax=Moniliophthora roreri (strain MCA 2997) TaxID=1381753 RepID=V2XIC3_MONRO|nr:hypothetical protein Moror_1753 [Moniliophthora roreri MCA 2997]
MLFATRFFVFSALLAIFFHCITASDTISPYMVHEKRSKLPRGWSRLRRRRLDSTEILSLRFGLKQSNTHRIAEFLHDVSHPDSPNYGNHWTPGKVADTFKPSQETVEVVKRWLTGHGKIANHRISVSRSRGWIELRATVEEAEMLLKTEYHLYTHEDGTEQVACTLYHLPEHVVPHIELVTPSVHFNAVLRKRAHLPAMNVGQSGFGSVNPKYHGDVQPLYEELEHCHEQITPLCLKELYGFYYTPRSAENNSFGVVEYTPQAYLQEDLDMFFNMFSKGLVGKSPALQSVDGGFPQRAFQDFSYNIESNLDLQYAMALVSNKQPVTLYQVGDIYLGASFNNFLDALDGSFCYYQGGDDPIQDGIYPDTEVEGGYQGTNACGTVKPAHVISTSYGYNEADLSPAYTTRQCDEYGKLGLMGVTVLVSSGDSGVAGNGGYCLNFDGWDSESGTVFSPGFPVGCPFVTSVGATQMQYRANVYEPEVACETEIYSGGGFSNHFAMPDYQREAVSSYLNSHAYSFPFSADVWNSTGNSRGFPDISANGANYVIASNGVFVLVYGTSASSPVIGAMLSMINDARISAGKKPVGFINPAIYSHQFRSAFNDITSGRNPGCGTLGFSAEVGWDPVSGLGTPKFPLLWRKWLELP